MTRSISLVNPRIVIRDTTSSLTFSNRWDHFVARLGIRRGEHRVEPGLYRIGNTTAESPVFVTANYSLSFDALRTALDGVSAYILALDTHGVNVWCAAGKHTFGTHELIRRIHSEGLHQVVTHRRLILPQLGAPGIAADEVKQKTGFIVEYGPVRAADLPEYLITHQASPKMRRVTFPLRDRLVLVPVELSNSLLPAAVSLGLGYLAGGWPYFWAVLCTWLGGTALFPLLLPVLPTHDFSTKGGFLGGLLSLPFIFSQWVLHPGWSWYRLIGLSLGYLCLMSAVVAYLSLNFTGSTPFTSRSGVRKEIYTYIRPMSFLGGAGLILLLLFAFIR